MASKIILKKPSLERYNVDTKNASVETPGKKITISMLFVHEDYNSSSQKTNSETKSYGETLLSIIATWSSFMYVPKCAALCSISHATPNGTNDGQLFCFSPHVRSTHLQIARVTETLLAVLLRVACKSNSPTCEISE